MSKIVRKRTRDEMNNGGNGQVASTIQNDEPIVEKCYMVEKSIDGKKPEKMLATIIHSEWRNEPVENSSSESEDDEEERVRRNVKTQMFYVHYEVLDRRMDEWVARNRIFEQVDSPQIMIPGIAACMAADGALTRSQRRIHEEFNHLKQGYDSMDATTAKLEKEHEERTKIKNIPKITIGRHCMASWYYSPFPVQCNNHHIRMCEYCLLYTPDRKKFREHYSKCKKRQPPGNEIYRKDNLSVFEIDGNCDMLYCQCLCLLSKLFMDHKTLYFDVDDFIFYVLCEVDAEGAHIVGYYSREVESNNNLACIMVFPPYQNKGYGKLLIQLSYEISQREGYVGTPEKPLSDLGKVSYRSYWWWVLLTQLRECQVYDYGMRHTAIGVSDLSSVSGIAVDDIISTFTTTKMLRQFKGNGLSLQGNQMKSLTDFQSEYAIRAGKRIIDHCDNNDYGKAPRIVLDITGLKWRPKIRRNEEPEFSDQKPAKVAPQVIHETFLDEDSDSASHDSSDASVNGDISEPM